ncbi:MULTISPECIES: hypothetical protein [unclassified Streptomyces]|uniref:hypothetical protein n=1 Tax=unclassified Streptomyces TaxID=2593676 RepID=UPI0033B1D33A
MHGDVSPRNILVGPVTPVLLDAECAWYGDPAFCATHLLLKSLVVAGGRTELLRSARVLAGEYVRYVDWEPRPALEARAVSLLPALLVARVDGKSPVEYLTDERQRSFVSLPGWVSRLPWATDPGDPPNRSGADPTPKVTSLLPAPGGTRFVVLTFPPDSALADPAFDPVPFDEEQRADPPGLAELIEPERPAGHLAFVLIGTGPGA